MHICHPFCALSESEAPVKCVVSNTDKLSVVAGIGRSARRGGLVLCSKGGRGSAGLLVSHPEGFCRILLTVVTLGRSIGPRGLAGNRQKYLSRKMRLCFNVKTSDEHEHDVHLFDFCKESKENRTRDFGERRLP
jgi:hypothetical protein